MAQTAFSPPVYIEGSHVAPLGEVPPACPNALVCVLIFVGNFIANLIELWGDFDKVADKGLRIIPYWDKL